MICILLNHLSLYPSAWQYFTGRGYMWVSAAEGFFFVSGIMVGLIRGSEYNKTNDFWQMAKKLSSRSIKIYLVYIGSTLVSLALLATMVALGVQYAPATVQGTVDYSNINNSLWRFLNLSQVYGWADFLKFYVVFLIASIPALWLLKQKMWYLLVAIAALCWIEPRLANFPFEASYLYWGAYFLLGTTVGYHYENIKKFYYALPKIYIKIIPIAIVSIFVLIVSANIFANFYRPPKNLNLISQIKSVTLYRWQSSALTNTYFYKSRTGILRLPVFFIFAGGIYIIFRYFEDHIKNKLDWLLGEMGRNSLRAYVVGAFFTYIFRLWVVDTTFIYNTMVSAFFIFIILKTTTASWLKKIVPN